MTDMFRTMEWVTVTSARNHPSCRFLVKGTVLARAVVPGTLGRYVVESVRSYPDGTGGFPGETFRLRDADTVTDDEVRDGVAPRAVLTGTEEEIERHVAPWRKAVSGWGR